MTPKARAGPFGTQPLKRFLSEGGVTHASAAAAIGVATTHFVTDVVNGQARPSLVTAARLAELVGRPVTECFSREMLGLQRRRRRKIIDVP